MWTTVDYTLMMAADTAPAESGHVPGAVVCRFCDKPSMSCNTEAAACPSWCLCVAVVASSECWLPLPAKAGPGTTTSLQKSVILVVMPTGGVWRATQANVCLGQVGMSPGLTSHHQKSRLWELCAHRHGACGLLREGGYEGMNEDR